MPPLKPPWGGLDLKACSRWCTRAACTWGAPGSPGVSSLQLQGGFLGAAARPLLGFARTRFPGRSRGWFGSRAGRRRPGPAIESWAGPGAGMRFLQPPLECLHP